MARSRGRAPSSATHTVQRQADQTTRIPRSHSKPQRVWGVDGPRPELHFKNPPYRTPTQNPHAAFRWEHNDESISENTPPTTSPAATCREGWAHAHAARPAARSAAPAGSSTRRPVKTPFWPATSSHSRPGRPGWPGRTLARAACTDRAAAAAVTGSGGRRHRERRTMSTISGTLTRMGLP